MITKERKTELAELNKFLQYLVSLPTEVVVEHFFQNNDDYPKMMFAAHLIVKSDYRFSTPTELAKLKQPLAHDDIFNYQYQRQTLAHAVASCGYRFTVTELMAMGNPKDVNGETVAHFMARRRDSMDFFSVEELLQLKNPADKFGWTVAHDMAHNGYKFCINDLIRLGNPKDRSGYTVADRMVSAYSHFFNISELLALKKLHRFSRFTVPVLMASRGYKFSPEEIQALGNPKDVIETCDRYETWKYSTIHQNNSGNELPKKQDDESFRLLFRNGEPYFFHKNETGKRILVTFFWNDAQHSLWIDENIFELSLSEGNSGWEMTLQETKFDDPSRYLIEKHTVLELMEKLNNALRSRSPLDFGEYKKIIEDLFIDHEFGDLNLLSEKEAK